MAASGVRAGWRSWRRERVPMFKTNLQLIGRRLPSRHDHPTQPEVRCWAEGCGNVLYRPPYALQGLDCLVGVVGWQK